MSARNPLERRRQLEAEHENLVLSVTAVANQIRDREARLLDLQRERSAGVVAAARAGTPVDNLGESEAEQQLAREIARLRSNARDLTIHRDRCPEEIDELRRREYPAFEKEAMAASDHAVALLRSALTALHDAREAWETAEGLWNDLNAALKPFATKRGRALLPDATVLQAHTVPRWPESLQDLSAALAHGPAPMGHVRPENRRQASKAEEGTYLHVNGSKRFLSGQEAKNEKDLIEPDKHGIAILKRIHE